jgi:hypothetical protein
MGLKQPLQVLGLMKMANLVLKTPFQDELYEYWSLTRVLDTIYTPQLSLRQVLSNQLRDPALAALLRELELPKGPSLWV